MMRDSISAKMGESHWDRLANFLSIIEGKHDPNNIPLVNQILRYQDIARFSNPFVGIKQFANTPNIAVMFHIRDWVASLKSLPMDQIQRYLDSAGGGYLKLRFETNMQTPELLEHRDLANAKSINQDLSTLDKLRNGSTWSLRASDNYTLRQTITAAESYVSREMPHLKGEEKDAAITYAATEALLKLQPVGEPGWKVEGASKGLFGRLATRYQHVPLAMWNQLIRNGMRLDRHPTDTDAQIDFIKTLVFGTVASGAILAGADYTKEQYYSWLKQNYGQPEDKEEKKMQKIADRFKYTWMSSSADILPAGRIYSPLIVQFLSALKSGDVAELMRIKEREGQDPAFGSQLQNLARVMVDTVNFKNHLTKTDIKTGKQWIKNDEARRKSITDLIRSALDLISEITGVPLGSINKLTGASNLIP